MGNLPKKINEVCMVLHIKREAFQTSSEPPVLVEFGPEAVIRKRQLRLTNAVYSEHSCTPTPTSSALSISRARRRTKLTGLLVCRWTLKIYFIFHGRQSKPEEEVIERISFSDVLDPRYRVSDETICNRWRGGRIKGGSWDENRPFQKNAIDLEYDTRRGVTGMGRFSQPYTVFDAFCGTGGVSHGAQMAGFKVLYAVDKSPDVWPTYQLNFPESILYGMSVDEFIRYMKKESIRVDVLHLSPPCQYFSPAHTHQAAHDDDNIFALLGCNELINKTRPRLVTVEQTFGLTFDRHRQYLRAFIGDFTQFGYSVRWKIVRLAVADYYRESVAASPCRCPC